MKSYGIKKIEDKKKKYIDRIFILRQHLSGGALWSILRKLLKRKPKQNKMFVYESRFVDSKIVVSEMVLPWHPMRAQELFQLDIFSDCILPRM